MPIPLLAAAGGSLLAKGLGSFFGGRAKKKREEEQRRATIAGLGLQQKQGERTRLGNLGIAQSLLGGTGASDAYGGRVNPNTALDPELVARLGVERKDDFSQVVPRAGVGAGSAFLSGLFGGAGDVIAGLPTGGGGGDLQGVGGILSGGPGGITSEQAGGPADGGGVPALSIDELLALSRSGGGQ